MELPVVPLAGGEGAVQVSGSVPAPVKWVLNDKVMGGFRVSVENGEYKLLLFDSKEDGETYIVSGVLAGDSRLGDFEAVEEQYETFKGIRSWPVSVDDSDGVESVQP